jgi:hypothetical protein
MMARFIHEFGAERHAAKAVCGRLQYIQKFLENRPQ